MNVSLCRKTNKHCWTNKELSTVTASWRGAKISKRITSWKVLQIWSREKTWLHYRLRQTNKLWFWIIARIEWKSDGIKLHYYSVLFCFPVIGLLSILELGFALEFLGFIFHFYSDIWCRINSCFFKWIFMLGQNWTALASPFL